MKFIYSVALILSVIPIASCAVFSNLGNNTTPAAETQLGQQMVAAYEEAKTVANEQPQDEQRIQAGRDARRQCIRQARALIRQREGNDPVYNPDEERLPTGDGNLTINEISQACQNFQMPHLIAPFPTPGGSEPELEARLLRGLRATAENMGDEQDWQVVIMMNPGWRVINHEISGAILMRARQAGAGARWPDGHCEVRFFEVTQQFQGDGFTDAIQYNLDGSRPAIHVDCASFPPTQSQ